MKKKKKAISKAETYKVYIYKVLKQVHPDTGISSKVRCSGSSARVGNAASTWKGERGSNSGPRSLGGIYLGRGKCHQLQAFTWPRGPGASGSAVFQKTQDTVHSLVLYPPFLLSRPWAS